MSAHQAVLAAGWARAGMVCHFGTLPKRDVEELERVQWQAARVLSDVRRGRGSGLVSSGKEES